MGLQKESEGREAIGQRAIEVPPPLDFWRLGEIVPKREKERGKGNIDRAG